MVSLNIKMNVSLMKMNILIMKRNILIMKMKILILVDISRSDCDGLEQEDVDCYR